MTRSELIQKLAERFPQLTTSDAEKAAMVILDTMSGSLVNGHRIEIRGFGSFSVAVRRPRLGRNPRSNETVAVPERRSPRFKPGKALRESVDLKAK